MISPTGSGTSPSTPTVSSRPGTNCSAMTSASYARASVTAASSPSALRTRDMPTDEPMLEGFTITGQPRAVVTSSGATGGGAMNQAGTGTPAARNSRFARSLSIASALASAPLPVYGTPITSSTAWSVPPSPRPACRQRNSTSASRTAGSDASPLDRKSTRLNSSHSQISYAVFCLKKKIIMITESANELSGRLLQNQYIPQVRIGLPYADERLRFLQSGWSAAMGADNSVSDWSDCN